LNKVVLSVHRTATYGGSKHDYGEIKADYWFEVDIITAEDDPILEGKSFFPHGLREGLPSPQEMRRVFYLVTFDRNAAPGRLSGRWK
jgi:hypothetical protein